VSASNSSVYIYNCIDLFLRRAVDLSTFATTTFADEKNRTRIIDASVSSAKPVSPTPKEFRLFQNFPNPFNPDTWLPYELAYDTVVTIRIYDVKGQLVRELNPGKQEAGSYITKDKAAYWDGRDNFGENISSGVYLYNLQAGKFSAARKMVILK